MTRFKQLAFLGLVFIISLGFLVFFLQRQQSSKYANNSVQLPTKVEAVSPEISSSSLISPDGQKTLVMKWEKQGGETTYSFYSGSQLLLTKITSGQMLIPYNAWSVDNKHIFLKEEVNGQINFYVAPGNINVSDKFKEKFPDYTLQDMTGWAAENLLIVNANDGKNDVSFWFDLTSQTFITLSNRFN